MWEIRQVGDEWEIVDGAGERVGDLHGTYELAVAFLGGMLTLAAVAEPADDGTTGDGLLAEVWVADPAMCFSQPTPDGRDFTGCEWTSRDPSTSTLPLMLQTSTDYGHFGAQLAGFIEEITDLGAGTNPGGRGRFFDSEVGRQFRDMLLGGRSFGVSVDPGRVEVDWECTAEDEDGYCIAETAMFRAYEIIGLTGTPFPGFAEAAIRLDSTVAASAAPPASPTRQAAVVHTGNGIDLTRPPAAWFRTAEPQLGEPFELGDLGDEWLIDQGDGRLAMPLTITDDGRFAGHLAVDGQCHVGYPGTCVTPPASVSNYARFHVGEVVTAEGTRIATGALSAGCDHAASNLRAPEAFDHYAHNGIAWANARASAGVHGPWVCGAIRHDVTPQQLAIYRAGALSGDWRNIDGLDLIAILAVTTPGFPIAREAIVASGLAQMVEAPRVRLSMVGSEQVSLVASGIVRRCPDCARRATAAASAAGRGRPAPVDDRRLAAIEQTLSMIERRTRHLAAVEADHMASRIRT